MSIYLKDAVFIDFITLEFHNTNIQVEEGINKKILFIDKLPTSDELKPNDKIIDCKGKFVTKSYACGHHHVYSALARGMHPPKKIPQNFYEILKYIWWNLDTCLDEETIELSALTTAIACAKNGVTFAIDHHASPFAIENSLEIIANAFDKVGVSHLLCYEISDRHGFKITEKALEETDNYLKANQGLVGLHASFTVSQQTLEKSVELAMKHKTGIHVHVAEDIYDQDHCLNAYRTRVVDRFYEEGVLNSSKTILAHCLHLNDREREIIKSSEVYVVQNMDSNLNNKVGFFNSRGLGNNIMFGTDGMHSDMLKSAKSAFFVGQNHEEIDYASTYERFRKVHKYIAVNNFKGDGENNLVVLDYDTPTDLNKNNFLSHFIFGIESKHVLHVISNGKLIVKDKLIATIDENEVNKRSIEISRYLWHKMINK